MFGLIQKAFEAVLEQLDVEVDQESLFELRNFEVADDLGFMDGVDLIHALEFKKEGFGHDDIHAVGTVYRRSFVFKSERSLPAERDVSDLQFPAQAGLLG